MIKINLLPTKAARKKETTYAQLIVAGAALFLLSVFAFS
jgi:hypothetical protein